jgi:hypothetical protein
VALLATTGALGCRYGTIDTDAHHADAAAESQEPRSDAGPPPGAGPGVGPNGGTGAIGGSFMPPMEGGVESTPRPRPRRSVVPDDEDASPPSGGALDEDAAVDAEVDAGPSRCLSAHQAGCALWSGIVHGDGMPFEGATFQVTVGDEIYSATSAADASFALIVPTGVVFATISAPGFWDTEGYWWIDVEPPIGVINLYSPAWMQATAALVGRTQDPSKGWVFALFGGASGDGGEGVTLGLGSDVPLTLDATSGWVVSDRLVSAFPALHFSNVEPGVLDPQPFAPEGRRCVFNAPDARHVIRPSTYYGLLLDCGPSGP